MTNFRTRPFQSSDEAGINTLYNVFQGRTEANTARSLEYMRWLRYQGPAGPTDCWVIETETNDGWKIVGHHSLCPFRFTFGDMDLLCAKTLETIFLPEYRSSFSYPLFERECLEQVRSRYDATYSHGSHFTHYRKMLGYKEEGVWVALECGPHPFEFVTRLFARVADRNRHSPWINIARTWSNTAKFSSKKPPFELVEYNSEEAPNAPFFVDFWHQARGSAGMAARREIPDMKWRFWTRPNSNYVTLVHAWEGGARGYCIVENTSPFIYALADICVTPPRPDLLNELLDALFAWCTQKGALTLTFLTTQNGQTPELMEVFTRRMRVHLLQRFRMRRTLQCRLSALGKEKLGRPPRWEVTEMLLPG